MQRHGTNPGRRRGAECRLVAVMEGAAIAQEREQREAFHIHRSRKSLKSAIEGSELAVYPGLSPFVRRQRLGDRHDRNVRAAGHVEPPICRARSP